ncbi:MAG: hypothetical protein K0S49_45 [Microbacterium sp.]|jgi:DNA-binding NarL/FixJ family response regulator|nr:hypothetical protein [Microbacterium sp.]
MTATTAAAVFTCPPDHRHADALTCYQHHKCRCAPCTQAHHAAQNRRRRLQAYGRWNAFVPATRTRNHLRVLSASGIGHRRVAELTGAGLSGIRSIATGEYRKVRPDTEAKILAIHPDPAALAAGALIPARSAARRMQALYARGWTDTALAPHLGIERSNVRRIVTQKYVQLRTHIQIGDVYERLWNATPTNSPASQAEQIEKARRHGWVPPLAWDDIDEDDAPATGEEVGVDEIAIQLAVEGRAVVRLTREERQIAVIELNARRFNDNEIAARLGVSDKTIERDRKELELPANPEPYEERFAA